uniref:hypothetical protein n=1 Tax=Arthrobacter silvisoli TaxID=2291022 RepID=UPI003F497116
MAIVSQLVGVVAGTAPTFAAPSASDTVPIGSVLVVKNASGASINVTLTTPPTLETGDAYPDKVYAVAAGAEKWIPVLGVYQDPVTKVAAVAFSATASVTAAAIRTS